MFIVFLFIIYFVIFHRIRVLVLYLAQVVIAASVETVYILVNLRPLFLNRRGVMSSHQLIGIICNADLPLEMRVDADESFSKIKHDVFNLLNKDQTFNEGINSKQKRVGTSASYLPPFL